MGSNEATFGMTHPEDTDIGLRLAAQEQLTATRSALITDVDNTFYRADSLSAIAASWELHDLLSAENWPIIAATGNNYEPIMRQRVASGELPAFEVIVGSVGTEIWFRRGNTYVFDTNYDASLRQTGYRRIEVARAASELLTDFSTSLPQAKLMFQNPRDEAAYLAKPDPSYMPYRTSLFFFAQSKRELSYVSQQFQTRFPDYKIVICEEIGHNADLRPDDPHKKYCVDIVPVTKADAVNYLISKLRILGGMVTGDSGNDSDMLLQTPDSFTAVAVGGHKPELAEALQAAITGPGEEPFQRIGKKRVLIDTDATRMAAQTLLFARQSLRASAKQF